MLDASRGPSLKRVFALQLAHLGVSTLWNISGVVLKALGRQPLGPTASLTVAVALLLLASALWLGIRRSAVLYVVVSAVLGFAAFAAVAQALTGDVSLWPSGLWRWSGAAINFIGLCAALAGILIVLLRSARRHSGFGHDR